MLEKLDAAYSRHFCLLKRLFDSYNLLIIVLWWIIDQNDQQFLFKDKVCW